MLNRESKSIVWGVHQQHQFIIPPTVYPPREDTTLLANEITKLGPGKGRKALEIGSGSGALSLVMSQLGWKVEAWPSFYFIDKEMVIAEQMRGWNSAMVQANIDQITQ